MYMKQFDPGQLIFYQIANKLLSIKIKIFGLRCTYFLISICYTHVYFFGEKNSCILNRRMIYTS